MVPNSFLITELENPGSAFRHVIAIVRDIVCFVHKLG
jgi:hypothetical protein